MSDPQDQAEALDDDKMAVTDTLVDDLEYPPDEPMGVDEYGTTPAEERVDEPIEEREDRYQSEALPKEDGMRLVEPPDDSDEVGAEDTEGTSVARSVDASDLSAEEEAVHCTDPPPMDDYED